MKRIILLVFKIFILVFISFLVLIINGFNINNISYKDVTIDKLHVQYRSDLVLTIDNLEVRNTTIAASGILKYNTLDLLNKIYKFRVDDISFVFEPKLSPLIAKTLYVEYKDDNILLSFNKPSCDGINIDNSTAKITNITSGNTSILSIYIKSKALLESKLLNLLNFYNVKLPLYQLTGTNDVITNLVIPFNNDKIKVFTTVKMENAIIETMNIPIETKNLYVKLENNIVDIDLDINTSAQNINFIHKINLDKNISQGIAKIKLFKYNNLLDINNISFVYNVEIDKNIKVSIPQYSLVYTYIDKQHKLQIDSLFKIINFIPMLLDTKTSDASLTVLSDDDFNNTKVDINKLHIKFQEIKANNKENKDIVLPNVKVNAKDGSLNINDYTFNYDKFNMMFDKSIIYTKLENNISLLNTNININTNKISINSEMLSSEFINKVINMNVFKDGYISVDANGTLKNIKGKINIYKTSISEVSVLNNLMTFINTTPAIINPILALPTLFRLTDDKFSTNSYHVDNGYINFQYFKDYRNIYIEKLFTKGTIMDLDAKASIDLRRKKIHANVDVIFMKDQAKLLNYIPLVGYIITGDDGNFMTQIDVSGDIKNPSFETHTIKNTSEGIVNILRRTVTLPYKIIKDIIDINITK